MMYSMVGITALIICLIINKDLIFIKSSKNLTRYYKLYRLFIFANLLFFFVDLLWGFFDHNHFMTLLYIDTILYFIAQISCIFLWTICVSLYVNKNKLLNAILIIGGLIIVLFVITVLIINPFHPIVFKFDGYDYVSLFGRYNVLILQVIMFIVTMITAFIIAPKSETTRMRNRCILVGLFSLFMVVAIIGQAMCPLYPIYSIGIITSNCLIHTFIEMSDKKDSRNLLEELFKREQKQRMELEKARALINVDSLTGAQSKYAFLKLEDRINKQIANNEIRDFAIVVFDINGLKKINDIKGHDFGDQYIINSYQLITSVFKDIPVYRFGGDEFVVFLDEDYYNNRNDYLNQFNEIIDNNLNTTNPVLSAGMAIFDDLVDDTLESVFIKADTRMYERKTYLKTKELGVK